MYTEAYYKEKIRRLENALKEAAKQKAEMYEVLTTNMYSTSLTAQDFYDTFIREFEINDVAEEIKPEYHSGDVVVAPITYVDDDAELLKVSDFLISATVRNTFRSYVELSFSKKAQEKARSLLGDNVHLVNPDRIVVHMSDIIPMNIGSTIYLVDME